MKKIVLSLLSVAALASTSVAQLSIAPELGVNLASLSGESAGTTIKTKMKAGLRLGAVIDFELADNLYLQPGLFYVMTGTKYDGIDATTNINTIQIPINVQYKFGEEGGNRFFVGVGPYLGYNISAKNDFGGTSTTIDIGTDKAKDGLKPLDFGFGLNVGYQLSMGAYARVQYQMGLANLDPAGDDKNSMKNSGIGISVGYYFGGHKAKKGTAKKTK